ncbi:hypothetical protein [Desulfuribacillus alkaliarsenatis]|nr:hypothetical protein [Desulfuribacillus alkaliarsenatis]
MLWKRRVIIYIIIIFLAIPLHAIKAPTGSADSPDTTYIDEGKTVTTEAYEDNGYNSDDGNSGGSEGTGYTDEIENNEDAEYTGGTEDNGGIDEAENVEDVEGTKEAENIEKEDIQVMEEPEENKEYEDTETVDEQTLGSDITLSAEAIDSPLTQNNIHGAMLRLTLTNEEFVPNASLNSFILNNAPPVLTVVGFNRNNSYRNMGFLELAFTGEIDKHYLDFTITVLKEATRGSLDLNSNAIPIFYLVDGNINIYATTNPSLLYEKNLQGSVINLTINEGFFQSTLNSYDIQLNNAPHGVSIGTVVRDTPTQARAILSFNNDNYSLDGDVFFSVTVLSSGIKSASSATSNSLMIKATPKIDGHGSYTSLEKSYPTYIQVVGYSSANNQLQIYFDLLTTRFVDSTQTVTFHYFAEVYNQQQQLIGNVGDYKNTEIAISSSGDNIVQGITKAINLNQPLSEEYRVVITVKSVLINSS